MNTHNTIRSGNEIKLPNWLDDYIFNNLKANYCRKNKDLVVLDWKRDDILSYLGTYFPRSFAESYCIFSDYINTYDDYFCDKSSLSIFDFGCGTGGEIIGFLCAIKDHYPHINKISIRALDGNQYALEFLEYLLSFSSEQLGIDIKVKLSPIIVDDFYDLDVVTSIINQKFDLFITFKAICEFVTRQQFETKNPYAHIIKTFKTKLNANGIMCIADVTTYSDVSNDWLPKMMDRGTTDKDLKLIYRNSGFNEIFQVSHSLKNKDTSKIAWRILKLKNS